MRTSYLIVPLFCLFPLTLAVMATSYGDTNKSKLPDQKISLLPICQYLEEDPRWMGQNKRTLTYIDFGPEILYRTRHEVIATPYIRNNTGILDSNQIFTSLKDGDAYDLIQKRGIQLILLCPKSQKSSFYQGSYRGSTFHDRLKKGQVPSWLKRIQLPPDQSYIFMLFEVIK